jgi:hypothetical protein
MTRNWGAARAALISGGARSRRGSAGGLRDCRRRRHGADNHFPFIALTYGQRLHELVLHEREVDDAPFGGGHWFECDRATGLADAVGHAQRQVAQGFLRRLW